MYGKTHINILNDFGMLSSALLMRKFKYSNAYARKMLNSIAKDYANVYFLNENQICIFGREKLTYKKKKNPKIGEIKVTLPFQPRVLKFPKRRQWIDVTKPYMANAYSKKK